jgi:ComF family protein
MKSWMGRYFGRIRWHSCALCDEASDASVCAFCIRNFSLRKQVFSLRCVRCAVSLSGYADEASYCRDCLKHPPPFLQTKTLCDFEFPWNRLIHQMKGNQRIDLAHWFGQRMTLYHREWLARLKSESGQLVVVPIPLSVSSWLDRGFNQSLEVAKQIASEMEIPLWSALGRRRLAQTQHFLSKDLRQKNLKGVFVATQKFNGERVILIDDVYTTGATLTEAAKILINQGVKEVFVMTVCRTSTK